MSEPYWTPLGPAALADAGLEVAYAQITSPVTITATTEGGADSVIAAPSFTADGTSAYLVEFYSPSLQLPAAQTWMYLTLFLDGVQIGYFGDARNSGNSVLAMPILLSRRIVPAAGTRVFSVKAYCATGSGAIGGGAGGGSNDVPGFIRVTKVPSVQTPSGTVPGAVPVGVITPFAGSAAPTGWLLCNGAAVLRSTYPGLFAVIGTAYGAGDGSTTFNLPDLRGRIPVGKGSNAAVDTLGENDGVAEANRRPQHRHTPHAHSALQYMGYQNNDFYATGYGWATTGSTGSADGGSGNANDSLDAPAFQVVNYIIASG